MWLKIVFGEHWALAVFGYLQLLREVATIRGVINKMCNTRELCCPVQMAVQECFLSCDSFLHMLT